MQQQFNFLMATVKGTQNAPQASAQQGPGQGQQNNNQNHNNNNNKNNNSQRPCRPNGNHNNTARNNQARVGMTATKSSAITVKVGII